jgi:hypothetical protein
VSGVQKVQGGQAQIAALKDQISVQNKASHIEEAHASRELSCGNACRTRLQARELEELEDELAKLRKMAVLEQHAHEAAAAHLQTLQAGLAAEAAQWAVRAQRDSHEKQARLEVRPGCWLLGTWFSALSYEF